MITTTHALVNYSILKSKYEPKMSSWIIAGAILPDVFTMLYGVVMTITGVDPKITWGSMYFSDTMFPIFSLTHSLLIFPLLALLFSGKTIVEAITQNKAASSSWLSRLYNPNLSALFVSWVLHIIVDFGVHSEDAYMHFWPLSDYRFISPVSYWNPNYFGTYFSIFEAFLVIILVGYQTWAQWNNNNRKVSPWLMVCWLLVPIMAVRVAAGLMVYKNLLN